MTKVVQNRRDGGYRSVPLLFSRVLREDPWTWKAVARLEVMRNAGTLWCRRFHPAHAGVPANVGINLTRRCNLKCRMCTQNRHNDRGQSNMPWYDPVNELPIEAWITLIDEMAAWRPWLSVTGGEPLLYDHFREFIQYAHAKHLPMDLTTNGLLMEEMVDFLVEQGVHIIHVSVDGPEDVHERVRGMKGAFNRTMSALRALAEARRRSGGSLPLIVMNFTIIKANLHVLDRMVPLALDAGVDLLQVIHPFFNTRENVLEHNRVVDERWAARHGLDIITPSIPESEYYENEIDEEDLPLLQNQLAALRTQAGGRLALQILPDLADDALGPYYLDLKHPFSQVCKALWFKCRVQPDGSVSPCFHIMAGNITERPLLELWNGPQMRRFRELMAQGLLPGCARCCNRKF